ncbi:MAG: 6-phosphofructo-2-kinase, partial [Olpidium bornovanus]
MGIAAIIPTERLTRIRLSFSWSACQRAGRLARYLRWLDIKTKVYDVGDYRRNIAGVSLRQDANALDGAEEQRLLEEASERSLDDLLEWFGDSYEHTTVAMYDATNLTRERRAFIRGRCQKAKVEVMFIESICHDEDVITQNIRD